jgi:hypothetical protein
MIEHTGDTTLPEGMSSAQDLVGRSYTIPSYGTSFQHTVTYVNEQAGQATIQLQGESIGNVMQLSTLLHRLSHGTYKLV